KLSRHQHHEPGSPCYFRTGNTLVLALLGVSVTWLEGAAAVRCLAAAKQNSLATYHARGGRSSSPPPRRITSASNPAALIEDTVV
ncbi:hypothetical protein BHE74_00055182, partial [Ensete ventricosum]